MNFTPAPKNQSCKFISAPKILACGFAIILAIVFLSAAAAIAVKAAYAESFGELKSEVKTSSGNLATRVAPGELLPVSVKLVNFGGGRRVDVTIDYFILNEKGDVVLTEKETVAVETTASFIKILQIPRDIQPGQYTAESSITYQGQKVPATASYQFTVERKIAGMFMSQFFIYGVITLMVGIIFAFAGLIVKKNFARVVLRRMNILK